MKKTISLIVFTVLSFSAQSQIQEPEPMDSDVKTEFRHSIFQSNYLTQKVLVRFLEQNCELISFDSDSLKIRATDLYFDKSRDYKREKIIVSWLKEKYLTSIKNKIDLLDSVLNSNKKWRTSSYL